MHRVIHLQLEAAPKPAVGEPCNGCGVCCAAEPCPIGMLVSRRRRGACAALVWVAEKKQYRCGVASEPERYVGLPVLGTLLAPVIGPLLGRAARRLIAAGKGCDCDLSVESPRPA